MLPLAIALQALLVGPALAQQFDAHGPALPPDGAGVTDPLLSLAGAHTGAPTLTVLTEAQSSVLVRRLAQDERYQDTAVVDDLLGLNLGFQAGIYGPLGVGVSVPAWYLSNDGEVDGGFALGDATLWVPLGLVELGGFRAGVAPFLGLPTGSDRRFLGEPTASGGALGTASLRYGKLLAAADLGFDVTGATGVEEWPGGLHSRVATDLGLIFTERLALHGEVRSRSPVGRPIPTLPIEAMGTLKVAPAERIAVTLSAGRAVTRGVGASAFHMFLGVSFAPGSGDVEEAIVAPPEFQHVHVVDDKRFPIQGATITAGGMSAITDLEGYAELPPRAFKDGVVFVEHPHYMAAEHPLVGESVAWEVELMRAPVDLAVSVVGPDGALMVVEVELDGPYEPGPARIDEAGVHHWELEPGSWFVRMSSPGLGSQERTILIEKSRVEPIRVDAVLASELDTSSRVRVEVVDRNGRPVEDAVVALSDRDLGTTGTGGDMVIEGLGKGQQELVVRSEKYGDNARVNLIVVDDGEEQTVQAVVDWKPGSVQVKAANAKGQPVDATVSFIGAAHLPTRGVGSDGDEVFTLRPGKWDVEVSAPGMATQVRTIEVTDEGGDLVVVDVGLMGDQGGDSAVQVRLSEIDGSAASNVEVFVDGQRVGETGPDGRIELQGLNGGSHTVTWGGGLTVAHEQTVELAKDGGTRVVEGTVRYVDGVTEVRATGANGMPVNATVDIQGPHPVAPGKLGSDGQDTYKLGPGEWTVEINAPGMATQRRTFVVEEGRGTKQELGFAMIPEGEAGKVAVRVVDPEGKPVEDALVSLDGKGAGRTSEGEPLVSDGVAAGRVEVAAVAEGMRPAAVEVKVDAGGEQAVDVPLEWAPGAMRVEVTGPGGAPVEARVTLRAADGSAVVPPRTVDGSDVIGARPGSYEMVVEAEGLRTKVVPVSLADASKLTVVPVELEKRPEGSGASVVIKAEDESGKALVNAEVKVAGEVVGRTSAAGTFELFEVDPGKVDVVITPESGRVHEETAMTVQVGRRDERTDRQLTAAVIVEDAAREVGVTVTDSIGNTVPAQIVAVQGAKESEAVAVEPGQNGTLKLKPGTYVITAKTEDGALATTELVVPRLEGGDDPSSAFIPGMGIDGRSADGVAAVDVGGAMPMLSLRVEQVQATVAEGTIVPVQPILFDTGMHVLRADAQPLIRDLALWLQANREAALVEVGGHTDNVGGVVSNQQLSERRARSVVAALIELGVAPERLEARGYGLSRPVSANLDADSRQRNRRVELVVKDWIEQ